MKFLYTSFLLLAFSLSTYSQEWTSKSYVSLKISFPENWEQFDYVNDFLGHSMYGVYDPAAFKEGNVSLQVIEGPNELEVTDAHNFSDKEMKGMVQQLFWDDCEFQEIGNRKVANKNAKYAKASGPYDDSQLTYIFFHKGQMIILKGVYTTKNENEFLPELEKIIRGIELL